MPGAERVGGGVIAGEVPSTAAWKHRRLEAAWERADRSTPTSPGARPLTHKIDIAISQMTNYVRSTWHGDWDRVGAPK